MDVRLQQLIDRQDIVDQMHTYARHTDLNQGEELVKVFTEDCRVSFVKGDDGWMHGRDAMLHFVRTTLALYSATNHTVSNIEITFDGTDTARAQSYVQAWHRWIDGERPDFLAYGRYHDVWVRTPDGWRMRERRFKANAGIGRSVERNEPIGRA